MFQIIILINMNLPRGIRSQEGQGGQCRRVRTSGDSNESPKFKNLRVGGCCPGWHIR